MQQLFYNCKALTSINGLSDWDTYKVINMKFMFCSCIVLTQLDLSGWDTSNVINIAYLFKDCSALKTIYASNLWSTTKVTSSSGMFDNCSSLIGAVPYDSSKTDASMANYTTGYLTYKAHN